MATYLDLISFTDQGIRKVKHSPQGAKAATCGGETWDQDSFLFMGCLHGGLL